MSPSGKHRGKPRDQDASPDPVRLEKSVPDLVAGRIVAPFGVQGWVRVHPLTEALDTLLDVGKWRLLFPDGRDKSMKVLEGRPHGRGLVAQLKGIGDRDQALLLVGAEIRISRDDLPEPDDEEYYWIDMVGCRVQDPAGNEIGAVRGLFETGSNEVLVVADDVGEERLFPFTRDVVLQVDLSRRLLIVAPPDGL